MKLTTIWTHGSYGWKIFSFPQYVAHALILTILGTEHGAEGDLVIKVGMKEGGSEWVESTRADDIWLTSGDMISFMTLDD